MFQYMTWCHKNKFRTTILTSNRKDSINIWSNKSSLRMRDVLVKCDTIALGINTPTFVMAFRGLFMR